MTLEEALQSFDHVVLQSGIPLHPQCCGLPVVMDSQDGKPFIYCMECGRTIALVGRGWIVRDWGKKGIKVK